MKEKECKICTWIHHVSTVIGLFTGIRELLAGKRGGLKEGALILYIITQTYAAVKIAVSLLSGRERLDDSYENIQRLYKNKRRQRGFTWLLTGASSCLKIGIPVWLR